MADQPSSSVNPAPHSRGGRHRSRKQQKPSTAEREQKKASRLQALGPGESIKEKQVSDDCKPAKTFMTSWGLACHATRSWLSWCCRNVFFTLSLFLKILSFCLGTCLDSKTACCYVVCFSFWWMLTLNFVRRSVQSFKNELQINLHRRKPTCSPGSSGIYGYFFVNRVIRILSCRQGKRSRQSSQ